VEKSGELSSPTAEAEEGLPE